MGILDNLENAWDEEFSFNIKKLDEKNISDCGCNGCSCSTESAGMKITDNMGREIFWEDLGRP